ncbi:predicted protein [Naegleria gruberi]|uniref:Predicted protein n=1 Tax=Naegleria gruberi TaxID=5762 RepID=D2VS22_NAEGR|nr:uncharacterized protein NAEGRDRAFT_71785 [Naegleria gruberi]EFC40271.1 predicted protein [Naegleria gruberi]|eukprot:XP_002673015.1 predicted protein [Naegleria gruberi strain NEG-M]
MSRYGLRFFRTPSQKEDRALTVEPSNESLITVRKLFMIECKMEILNILQLASDHESVMGNLKEDETDSDSDKKIVSKSSAEERIKYYSNQLEESKKIVQDLDFIQLVENENNLDALERLKIRVVDPEEIN